MVEIMLKKTFHYQISICSKNFFWYLLIILFFFIPQIQAQYFLEKASGNSGIFHENDRTTFSYDLSSSKFGLTYGFNDEPAPKSQIGEEEFPEIPPKQIWNINLGIPIDDNIGKIFDGGALNSGFEGAVESAYFEELPKGYLAFWGRGQFKFQENKFGFLNSDSVLNLEDKVTRVSSISGGINWGVNASETLRLGISGSYSWNHNSPIGLKKRLFFEKQDNFILSDNETIEVVEQKERYLGSPQSLTATQIRIDWICEIMEFEYSSHDDKGNDVKKKGPALGILGAYSFDKIENSEGVVQNFALGLSLHPEYNFPQIVGALYFEVIDLENTLKLSPKFKDKFRIRFYVGVPLALFKD